MNTHLFYCCAVFIYSFSALSSFDLYAFKLPEAGDESSPPQAKARMASIDSRPINILALICLR